MAPRKSSSSDEQEKLVKEIKKIRKNIRKKHQILTQNVIDLEQFAEKSLKPVTTPLQKLVQEKSKMLPIEKTEQGKNDVEMDDVSSRLPNKRSLEDLENKSFSNKRVVGLLDPELKISESLPHEEAVYETLPTVQELLSTPEGRKSTEYYLDNWFKGPVVKQYMRKFFNDKNHSIDNVFGPYFGEGDKLMLGKYPIAFEDNGDIIIKNVTYKGTPGLYELIFMKKPDEYVYSEEDLAAYSLIIKETSAYLSLSTNKRKSSSSHKYKNIIKPIIDNIPELSASIPRTTRWQSNVEGRGLLRLTNNKPDYIYWNNLNELCDRLQLLIASRHAGHSGHENEILSIIEELHEAGVIKEDAATVETIFTK